MEFSEVEKCADLEAPIFSNFFVSVSHGSFYSSIESSLKAASFKLIKLCYLNMNYGDIYDEKLFIFYKNILF